MSGKWTLIKRKGNKELYRWEKIADGQPATFFRGKVYMIHSDGSRIQTPEDPFFQTEEEARSWLDG